MALLRGLPEGHAGRDRADLVSENSPLDASWGMEHPVKHKDKAVAQVRGGRWLGEDDSVQRR